MTYNEIIEQGKNVFATMFENSIKVFEESVFEKAENAEKTFEQNDVYFAFIADFYGRENTFQMHIRSDNPHVRDFVVSKNEEGYKVFDVSNDEKMWEENKGIVIFDIYAMEEYAQMMDRFEGSN